MSKRDKQIPLSPPLKEAGEGGANEGAGDGAGRPFVDSDLARAYHEVDGEEPTLALDEAIRAAARRAVHARPQPRRQWWLRRWAGPVALAAVVVLTVSIGLLSVEEKPEMAPPPLQQAMKPRAAAPPEAPTEAKEETPLPTTDSGRADRSKTERAPPEEMPSPAEAAMDKRSTPHSAPAGAPSAPRAPERKTVPAAEASAPFVADAGRPGIKTEAPPDADAIDQGLPARKRQAVEPPLSKEPTGLPPGPLRPKPAVPAAAPPGASQAPAEAGSVRAVPKAMESRALARPGVEAETADTESPDAWLRRIQALHREGKMKEAEEELAKFKRRYPDFPLPPELREAR